MRIERELNNRVMLTYGSGFMGGLFGLFIGHFLYQLTSEFILLYYGMILVFVGLPLSKKAVRSARQRTRAVHLSKGWE